MHNLSVSRDTHILGVHKRGIEIKEIPAYGSNTEPSSKLKKLNNALIDAQYVPANRHALGVALKNSHWYWKDIIVQV